ncbi:hypothetical protein ACT2FY_42860 [Paraburkholderia fungorum]|uniref:hypothetical protein n=1 Tax=Paraburkholderia fungorum TaxID=134537 RepID=UPI00402B9A6B
MRILTLQNPQDLDSVPALREALGQANETLVQMTHELSVANGSVVQALDTIARMAAHHVHGNTDEVLKILDEVLAQYR